MQINNVSAGYSDPATLDKWGENLETVAGRHASADVAKSSSKAAAVAALGKILSHYDVTDISPNEFSEMIQKLYEAHAISDQELQQLTTVRHDLDIDNIEPDQSINLLEYYVNKIKDVQRRSDPSDPETGNHGRLSPLLHRLDWMEKFATIQATPDAIGLDVVA